MSPIKELLPLHEKRWLGWGALALLLGVSSGPVRARELIKAEPGPVGLSLGSALKSTAVLTHYPDDSLLYPEPDGSASYWRLRLTPSFTVSSWLTGVVAYEQQLRNVSEGMPIGLGMGGVGAPVPGPYRIEDIDPTLIEVGTSYSLRQELDWAYLSLHFSRADLTIGRQPIGSGRSLLFSAVDIFAPFSPLEVDREWRRGVDAARLEIRATENVSVDLVAAGPGADDSAYIGRLKVNLGAVDLDVVGGLRDQDIMLGTSASATLGEIETHLELAGFEVDELPAGGGLWGLKHWVGKAVLGGSARIPVGTGLTVFADYHYSGFGTAAIEDVSTLFSSEAFIRRYARGDTQTLGRHALSVIAAYDLTDLLNASLTWLQNPVDGSGLLSPSLNWSFAENVTVVASAFVPYGRVPQDGVVRSEYGLVPVSGFLQLRLYD